MRWLSARQLLATVACIGSLAVVVSTSTGCEQLDGRNRTRKGNRLFRETQFIDAAAEYQKALTQVDDAIIHYNLGLAYSKVFKPGFDGPVLLGRTEEFVCQMIPGAKAVDAGACVKDADRHYSECGEKKVKPIADALAKLKGEVPSLPDPKPLAVALKEQEDLLNKECVDLLPPPPPDPNKKEEPKDPKAPEPPKKTEAELKAESKKCAPIAATILKLKNDITAAEDKKTALTSSIKDKEDEIGRLTCPSSFRCMETQFCSLTSPELADLAAQHFQVWIKTQPDDDQIKKDMTEAVAELEEAKKTDNKSRISAAQKRVDDLGTKDQTRGLMTQLWLDSNQFQKALDYWDGLSKERPNDSTLVGIRAGIYLKAGDWRKSIENYAKVAEMSSDVSSKIAAYQFIGNVAWSKLNSKTLPGIEVVELADRGLAALQAGQALQPKNPKLVGLQASLYNFRSTAQGSSWASAIDRASAAELMKLSRVLSEEAKKAQGQAPAEAPAKPPTGGG